jgi:hypothetical protein
MMITTQTRFTHYPLAAGREGQIDPSTVFETQRVVFPADAYVSASSRRS